MFRQVAAPRSNIWKAGSCQASRSSRKPGVSSREAPIPLVAGNWKMNPNTADEALDLVRGVLSVARGHANRVEVAVFPPFPWLMPVYEVLAESGVKLGAQDCFWEPSGPHPGEVSLAMRE